MPSPTILAIHRLNRRAKEQIIAVDTSVKLIDAGGWFDGEIRETWPRMTSARYLAADAMGNGTRAERDALLAKADIVLGGWPYPLDLRARAPKLKWFHQRPAGASNLRMGDLWGSNVIVTTSRGAGNTLAMAEYVLAGMMYFAKGLGQAVADAGAGAFNFIGYKPMQLAGKTVCVVGAGGIGQDVGARCAALGLNVVGTRRQPDPDAPLPPGFLHIGSPDTLDELLPESDFVAICCQWTPETTNLFDSRRFALMKPGAILVNVARGEIIDEAALREALDSGQLRGAVLDVYVGEFEHEPPKDLWSHPRVLITPHMSAASDQDRHKAIDIFCRNLRAFLNGAPLENVIDWKRGY